MDSRVSRSYYAMAVSTPLPTRKSGFQPPSSPTPMELPTPFQPASTPFQLGFLPPPYNPPGLEAPFWAGLAPARGFTPAFQHLVEKVLTAGRVDAGIAERDVSPLERNSHLTMKPVNWKWN
jgi:hypothetical protein